MIERLSRVFLSPATHADPDVQVDQYFNDSIWDSEALYLPKLALTNPSCSSLASSCVELDKVESKAPEELIVQSPVAPSPGRPVVVETVRGWLVVFGGFLAYTAIWGPINAFGTYQAYYQEHLRPEQTATAVSWIGSIQLFMFFIGGVFCGPLFDKLGARKIFIPGSFVYVIAFMLTSISTKLWQIILAQGILLGIGEAMLFYPVTSSIPQWFGKHRGAALGLAIAGSATGGITWPFLLDSLIQKIGFAWATRVGGFFGFGCLIPCYYLVREKRFPATGGKAPPKHDPKAELAAMFHSKVYVLCTVAYFFLYSGLFVPFYYLVVFGLSNGFNIHDANNLLPLLNAGSFVGRIVAGVASDKLGRFNVASFLSIGAGILFLALHKIESKGGIQAFSVLYGFLSGGLISVQTACVASTAPNPATMGMRIGIQLAICSFAALSGSPIAGALLGDNILTYNWDKFINFGGITIMLGALFFLVTRFVGDRRFLCAF